MKPYLIHSLIISGESEKTINSIKEVRGKIKSWEEAKYVLDNFTKLDEIEKQCILNIAYKFSIINEN